MKWLLVVGFASQAAHAETFELKDVDPIDGRPSRALTDVSCNRRAVDAEWVRTQAASVSGVRVEVLHACSGIPIFSALGLRVGSQWYVVDGFLVRGLGSDRTEPQGEITSVAEAIRRGTFRDGSPAVVYQSVTLHDHVLRCDSQETCRDGVAETKLMSDVLVCRVDDGVACGRISYRCPQAGCGRAAFVRGELAVAEEHVYELR
jgi:hypothetical protein